jgi:hypothetical protein
MFVSLMTQFNQALGRRDGHRKHEPLRIAQTRGAQRCPVRCAGGDAVVDHDSRASSDFGAFAAAQIQLAPPDLRELGPAGGGKIRLFDAGVPDTSSLSTTIEAPPSTTAPIASFGWKSDANLADQMRSRRRGERGGYLGGHDHAAARQRQRDRLLARRPRR